jgi:hypothetical protein
MRANLAEREELFGQLVPWDHANYGMDEPWFRCHPYEQQAVPSKEVTFDLVATNHSAAPRRVACRTVLPRAWTPAGAQGAGGEWVRADVAAKAEGRVRLSFRVPDETPGGRHVIPVDVVYGNRDLPQFTEGIVVI